jgi:hypothetical protein
MHFFVDRTAQLASEIPHGQVDGGRPATTRDTIANSKRAGNTHASIASPKRKTATDRCLLGLLTLVCPNAACALLATGVPGFTRSWPGPEIVLL